MPSKYSEIFYTANEAYDFSIKIKKTNGVFTLYFLQISAEFTKESFEEYNMLNDKDRILFKDSFEDPKDFFKILNVAKNEDIINNEEIGINDIIKSLKTYPYLKKVATELEKQKK
jgi:hypothetical protein